MLIAKGCPVMRVYRVKGRQRGYGGHVVNLAKNIGDFVNSLPRPARELPVIVVRRQGEEGINKDLFVRRQRVFDAINWLREDFVVLRLERYTWPVWSSDPRYEGCVSIAPFETSWSTTGEDRIYEIRRQVPLALCWSITMHKSQGQTMDKAFVDLGKSESTAGLTFVCLSRAKRLVDLLIEPMPLERLSKIGDTPTFQLQLREEVRLRALAGETLHLHGGEE